jgi:Calcineurin-like phosphoesterase
MTTPTIPEGRRAVLVQLSDIHLKDDARNAVITRTEAIVAAVSSCAFGPDKDLVVVLSGDLAFKGSEAEFGIASAFLEDLRRRFEASGEYGQVQWVVVPGNHDCVLPSEDEDAARLTLANQVIAKQDYRESMLKGCLKAQDNYFAFVAQHFGLSFDTVQDKLYRFQVLDLGGHKLGFHLFNTAWLSRRHEKPGQLAVPVDELSIRSNGCDIAVGVLHHPDNWLDPHVNRRAVRTRLEKVADVVFTGHEHETAEYQKQSRSSLITYFEGGVLQDSNNVRNSGFNVLVLDLGEKTYQSYAFTLQDDRYVTQEHNPPMVSLKEKSVKGEQDFVFRPEFRAVLAKGGVALVDGLAQELQLGDYYIYPDLQENQHEDADQLEVMERRGVVRAEKLVDMLAASEKVMITGDRRSGKSALAVTALQDLAERGYVPMLLNGTQLRSEKPLRLHDLLKDAYDAMYSRPAFQLYLQEPKATRLLVVDDFDTTPLGHAQLRKALDHLHGMFGKVLLVGQAGVTLTLPLEDGEQEHPLTDYRRFEIRTFGKTLSLHLIRNYLGASQRHTPGLSESEFVRQVDDMQKAVSIVLRNNFLPAYPIFILLVLQHRQVQPNQGVTHASYGYLLEVVIKYNIAQAFQSPERYDTAKQFLSELAMHMYRVGRHELTEREFFDVLGCYKSDYASNIREDRFTQDLLESLILEKSDDVYRFRFLFQYFYFAATYLAETLEDPGSQAVVTTLSGQLEVKENSEIMVFLGHLSRSPLILQLMLDVARRTLGSFTPASFGKDIERLEESIDKVPAAVRGAFDAMKNREQLASQQDKFEPVRVSTQRYKLDRAEVESEIGVAFRVLDVLGQILRSRAGSLRAHQKEEIVEAAYNLGRRGMTSVLELLQQFIDYLRSKQFRLDFQEHVDDITHEELNDLVRISTAVLSKTAQIVALMFIKQVSTAVGSEMIGHTYDALKQKHSNLVVDLLHLSIKLDLYQTGFPFADLNALADDTKDSKYGRSVLQLLVLAHLRLFQRDRPVVQQALSTVGLKQVEERTTLVKR